VPKPTSLTVKSRAVSRHADVLARESPGPEWQPFCPPPFDAERESTDAGEEVTLCEAIQICGGDFADVSLVNESKWQTSIGNPRS